MSNDSSHSKHSVQKATLDALVRKRINVGRSYPAQISQVLGSHTYAKIFPPILRWMQSEHPDLLLESPLQIHTEGLEEGNCIMMHRIDNTWVLSDLLSLEKFEETSHKHIQEQLLTEASLLASPLARRVAKRKFEQWFALTPQESHPWGLPGQMQNGRPIISRKILEWCSKKGGAAIEQAIRRGTPKADDWGKGNFFCAVFPIDDPQTTFLSVVVSKQEYENIMKQWRILLDQSAQTNFLAPVIPKTEVAGNIIPVRPTPASPQSEELINYSQQQDPLPELLLPPNLKAVLDMLRLPKPTPPLGDHIKTLISWTESQLEPLQKRSLDFLLMLLAEGEDLRANDEVKALWPKWHRTINPIEQLALIVDTGEEPMAIQALFSPYAPPPDVSQRLTSLLLERWKKTFSKGTHASTQPKSQESRLLDIRKATRTRGLRAADIWVDRFFISLLSAHLTHTPIVLVAPRQLATQLLQSVISPCFPESHIETLRLNRRKSHLFGKISRERDIFQLSDLAQALRRASHSHRNRAHESWNPYLILIEDIAQHARTADIANVSSKVHTKNGVLLFSEDENQRWLQEYRTLHSKNDLSLDEQERRNLLEEFFSPELLGAVHPENSWRLHTTPNAQLLGILDTSHAPKELDLLSHAFVLTFPDIDILSLPSKNLNPINNLLSINTPRLDKIDAWEHFPRCRQQLFAIMRCLSTCNFQLTPQLSQQVSTFLSVCAFWGIPDGPIAASHLLQTLFLPRIRCRGNIAVEPLAQILEMENLAPDLIKRLAQLRGYAIQHKSELFHGALR